MVATALCIGRVVGTWPYHSTLLNAPSSLWLALLSKTYQSVAIQRDHCMQAIDLLGLGRRLLLDWPFPLPYLIF